MNSKQLVLAILIMLISSTAFAGKITHSLQKIVDQKTSTPNYVLSSSQNGLFSSTSKVTGALLVEVTTKGLTKKDKTSFNIPGVKVLAFSTKYNRVSLEIIDLSQLVAIEKLKKVMMINRNYGGVTHVGSVTSRALGKMNPPLPVGATGLGQKIGILSRSFARTTKVTGLTSKLAAGNTTPIILMDTMPQKSGDLPATIDLREDNRTLSLNDEGAAMAELIYDIAPDSSIAFHSIGNDETSFATGIDDLCGAAQSNIVVADAQNFHEPVYQIGPVAQATIDCINKGISFFAAIGNSANKAIKQSFKDINPALNDQISPPSGNDLHDWGNTATPGFLKVTVSPGSFGIIVLQWNQPFMSVNADKGAEIDLNLYSCAAADITTALKDEISSDVQGTDAGVTKPFGDAFEIVLIPNLGGTTDVTRFIAIENLSGSLTNIPQDPATPLEVNVAFFGGIKQVEGINNNTAAYGTIASYGHSTVPGVVSVAAVPWFDITRAESFSSRGGDLTIFFDSAGNFNPLTRFIPDIAAVDGNNTTFFGGEITASDGIPGEPDGFPNFFGSSAAVANAAGVAALALELDSTLTPTQISTLFKSTARDVIGTRGAVGVDDVTGAGLIDVSAFLAAVISPSGTASSKQAATNGSSGGCSLNIKTTFDPLFPGLLLLVLWYFFRKHKI
ncbi:MAG: S8 family serine peptidase [Thiohalomonadales bacterium]